MLRSIRRLLRIVRRLPEPIDLGYLSPIGAEMLRVALLEIGNGEEGGNNRGPHLERFKTNQFTGKRFGGMGPWCAAFCMFALETALINLGRGPLFPRTHSARKLWECAGKSGAFVKTPQPGDLALFSRKGGKHIGIVETVSGEIFTCIEGNVGGVPGSPVRSIRHHTKEPRLIGFARLG